MLNSANPKISNFSPGLACLQILVSFGARLGCQKCAPTGRKIIIIKAASSDDRALAPPCMPGGGAVGRLYR